MAVSLDDFVEQSWSVLNGLSEYLEQVSLVVVIYQDLVLLENVQVLADLVVQLREVLPQIVIIVVRNGKELGSSRPHGLHCVDDLIGVERNVLDSRSLVVVHVLLDLRHLLPVGRLVNGHLDVLVVVCHHDGSQGGVLSVDDGVVDGPESMEPESVLVKPGCLLHLQIWLIPNDMIDLGKELCTF